jgi:hypothetical protein
LKSDVIFALPAKRSLPHEVKARQVTAEPWISPLKMWLTIYDFTPQIHSTKEGSESKDESNHMLPLAWLLWPSR